LSRRNQMRAEAQRRRALWQCAPNRHQTHYNGLFNAQISKIARDCPTLYTDCPIFLKIRTLPVISKTILGIPLPTSCLKIQMCLRGEIGANFHCCLTIKDLYNRRARCGWSQ
jgi:hypothetical protein